MENIGHTLIQLIAKLSQLQNKEELIETFVENINHIFPGHNFIWTSNEKGRYNTIIQLSANDKSLSELCSENRIEMDSDLLVLLQNSTLIFRTIIEKLELAELIENEELTLQESTKEKLSDVALNEESFKNAFRNSIIGKSITTLDGGLRANRAFCLMLGYQEEELQNMSWQQITHPDDIEKNDQIIRSIISGERESFRFDKRYIHKNGKIIWVDFNTFLQRDDIGKPLYFITEIQDITEKKASVEALNESYNRFLSLADNIYGFMAYVNAETLKYEFVNKAFEKSFGISREKIVGSHIKDIIGEANYKFALKYIDEVRSGRSVSYENTFNLVSGKKWTRVNYTPAFDVNGNVKSIVVLSYDITERKKAEEDLRRIADDYRKLFENHSAVKLIIDPLTGKIRDANFAAANYYGWSRDELIQMNIGQINTLPPEEIKIALNKSDNRVESRFEFKHRKANGSIRDVEVFSNRISMEGKKYVHTIVIDITERKEAESALLKSESKFRALVESSSDLIWETNMDGVYTYVSPQIEHILGYLVDEVLYKSPFQFLVDDERKETTIKSDRIVESGLPFDSMVNKYRHKDGQFVYLETSGVPVLDMNGVLCGYRGVSRNITLRKNSDETILRFKKIFDMANFGTVISTISRELVYVNNYFAECHGLKAEDTIGQKISIFHTADQMHDMEFKVKDLLGIKKLNALEIWHHHQNGADFPMLTNAMILFDGKGDPEFIAETMIDISEIKNAEEKIRDLNEDLEKRVIERTSQLEAANKELEAFAYSISHDLRAPLRHINGFINLFFENNKTALNEEEAGYLKIVAKSAKEMGELIDALLSFSRLNRAELNYTTINTEDLINQLLIFFSEEFKNRKIKLTVRKMPQISGDSQLIRQVWLNLLSNALKYTSKKELAQIEIGSFEQDSMVVFFIKDNGAGFNMNYQSKLFGVFQRLHKPREFEGIGIGLANVSRIITRHGGKCWAEAEVNVGATFYFSLPANRYQMFLSV